MQDKKAFWEVNEIDLNLRHYSGHPIDVIKKIKYNIEEFLSDSKIDDKTRSIYSAIYNSLDYYLNVSTMPSPGDFSNEETFLSYSIKNFNNDYKYLSNKYDSKDPTDPPVISLNCRIKSPLSFMEKVKEKISTYLEKGRDLKYFNESLRDLIGLRIVIDPPQEIKAQGLEAESNFLYQVYYDLMNYHGINNQNQTNLQVNQYRFIPVNTRYDPKKLSNIKARPLASGFSESITSGHSVIYIPQSRPDIIDSSHIDTVLKDFNKWPKFSGYQSLHTCAVPYYSDYVERLSLPPYIIPPASYDYAIEYQFRTQKQDDHAERGAASHKFSYKPTESLYHRLAVPFFITFDDPKYQSNTFTESAKTLKLRTFGESYEKFYGHPFEERFNISFKDFRNRFSLDDRNAILADKKHVRYDKENDRYYLEDAVVPIFLTIDEVGNLSNILNCKEPTEEIAKLFDSCGVTDSIIATASNSSDNTNTAVSSNPSIQVYPVAGAHNELEVNKTGIIKDITYISADTGAHYELEADKTGIIKDNAYAKASQSNRLSKTRKDDSNDAR